MSDLPGSDLLARELFDHELPEAARLRYEFFVRRRGWVEAARCADGKELDEYDPFAIHHGVFRGAELVGYMRAVRGEGPTGMMLDRAFRACLTTDEYARVVRPGSVELSRRVVAEHLASAERKAVAQLLFHLFYAIVVRERFVNVYLVQEPIAREMLRRAFGLCFRPLNAVPFRFPDGTVVNVDHASVASLLHGLEERGLRGEYERFLQTHAGG